ncbi:unnamed protein product [Merluccius merluccius]
MSASERHSDVTKKNGPQEPVHKPSHWNEQSATQQTWTPDGLEGEGNSACRPPRLSHYRISSSTSLPREPADDSLFISLSCCLGVNVTRLCGRASNQATVCCFARPPPPGRQARRRVTPLR